MLIPQDAVQFFSKKFQCVDRSKFVGFGKLIPISGRALPVRSTLTRVWRNEPITIHQQMKLARQVRHNVKEMTFEPLRP